MKEKIYIIIALIFCNLSVFAQVEFYVSPIGDDANAGTEEQPFASLHAARDAIRKYKNDHVKAVPFIVTVASGTYTMKEPFVLRHEDSGTPGYPVIYKAGQGATPVFSGGRKISGFAVNENGVWELKIPEIDNRKWRFDQVYVNDKRATLARTPNKGFLKIGDVKEEIFERGTGRQAKRAQQKLTFDSDSFNSIRNLNDGDSELIRLRAFHKWDFTIKHIDKIDTDSLALFISGKGMKPWNPLKKDGRIIFENYAAALDSVGEWFLDNDGTLFYKPLAGQTPENSVVVAPVLENLLYLQGNISENKFVEHIKFEGITFKYCGYKIPSTGYEPNQAAVSINAAIQLKGARNITILNCEISNTGQHALWFEKGCSNSLVSHCYLNNIGGGGIYLGDVAALDGVEHTHNITLDNNIIHSGGREFPPAVGIWVGHSSDNTITHNDIADFFYTGVSVGWVWGYKTSLSKRNTVTYNHIHHIGWDLLSDMAAVYTLGKSEGTSISNNVIHHIHAYSYGGWGLYTDEGSSGILMENNLVYSTKTGGFHQHFGENNTIENNIFAYAKLYQLQCTRVEAHRSFDFNNNIIVFDEGVVLKGAWEKIDIAMDNNLYWNTGGRDYDFNGKSYEEWQQSGHDINSLIANPNFKDASNFDFRLKSSKVIEKIHFKPFDYATAGVYGDKEWINKAFLPDTIIAAFNKAVVHNMKKD